MTKRRLHKALNFDVLVHDGGYRVNRRLPSGTISPSSWERWCAGVCRRRDKASAWRATIDLYRGPFMQDAICGLWSGARVPERLETQRMARIRLSEGRQEHARSAAARRQ